MNITKKVLAFVLLMSATVVLIYLVANPKDYSVINQDKITMIEESIDKSHLILMNDWSVDYVSHAAKKRKKFTIKHGAKATCLGRTCMFAMLNVPHEIRAKYSNSIDVANGVSYLVFDNVDTKFIFSNQKQLALVRYEISDF